MNQFQKTHLLYFCPAWIDDIALRRHGLSNESHSTRHGIPVRKLLVREAPQAPKTIQTSVFALN